MPPLPPKKTSDEILEIARTILADKGISALSFDAIARRLGRSKQAVLYWFPTKRDLLAALFLPCLEAEAETAVTALAGSTDYRDAIARFIRAVADFHLRDLDRFRMMYLLPQIQNGASADKSGAPLVEQVHPVTDRLYSTLAQHLEGEEPQSRKDAVAIHSAVLGLVLMIALADGLDDPLKHASEDLVESLIGKFTGR